MRKFLAVGVAVVGLVVQSYGAMLGEGTKEFHVSGRIDSDDDVNIMLQGGIGYFVKDSIEIGFGGDVAYNGSDENDATTLGLALFGEYDYNGGTEMIPYAGATLGLKYFDMGDTSEVPLEFSIYAGSKYYLMENLSLGAQLQVWMASDEVYVGDEEYTSTDWAIVIRTQFYF